jgi:hypothetical protein
MIVEVGAHTRTEVLRPILEELLDIEGAGRDGRDNDGFWDDGFVRLLQNHIDHRVKDPQSVFTWVITDLCQRLPPKAHRVIGEALAETGFPMSAAVRLALTKGEGANLTRGTAREVMVEASHLGMSNTHAFETAYLWRYLRGPIDRYVDLSQGGIKTYDFFNLKVTGDPIKLPMDFVTNWKLRLNDKAFDLERVGTITADTLELSVSRDLTIHADIFTSPCGLSIYSKVPVTITAIGNIGDVPALQGNIGQHYPDGRIVLSGPITFIRK